MSIFSDVNQLFEKMDFPTAEVPSFLHPDLMHGRVMFLEEELHETCEAYGHADLPEVIDGLIDLIYVATGMLQLMGVDGQKHWDEVHAANMRKVPGVKEGRDMEFDMRKPKGWVGPDHQRILDET